jgi:hypothetical protein
VIRVHSAGKPVWQQLTALVSLGASGAVTGFTFTPQTAADLTSPASLPVHLLALAKAAKPAAADDAPLRSAIVNFAHLFLRMARGKTPAQMESIIWQHDSVNGVDHGPSCAAFASLTLELAAQAVGQHSWVTGGTSYPWPLHKWVDARVESNPASPGITSVLQDAKAHHRWHRLGDGYRPQPGDWVLFPGHMEVVTKYAGGVLSTIGGDSLPNFSVNAHQYHDPLGALGVTGFVNNGDTSRAGLGGQTGAQPRDHPASRPRPPVGATESPAAAAGPAAVAGPPVVTAPAAAAIPAAAAVPAAIASPREATGPAGPSGAPHRGASADRTAPADRTVIPGLPPPDPHQARQRHSARSGRRQPAGHGRPPRGTEQPGHPGASAAGHAPAGSGVSANPIFPGLARPVAARQPPAAGTAPIPGLPIAPLRLAVSAAHHRPHSPAASHTVPETRAQQAFINEIAPGAVAAQRRYGVPASVTIAQAIVESGWGQSQLASHDHNLFGIKGTGPGGSVQEPSWEYLNGQSVQQTSSFRVYRSAAESIDDHGKLLATSGYYRRTMTYRRDPNAFASSLTGVYATDPEYGTTLISLMRRYNLYRYDQIAPVAAARTAPAGRGPAAGPVPPVTPPAPAVVPGTSPPGTPPPTSTAPAATEPGNPGPSISPQPVTTPAVNPGPLPAQPVLPQPVPAPPATPGPVVTLPASPGPAVSQPGTPVPGGSRPDTAAPVVSPSDRPGPASRRAAGNRPAGNLTAGNSPGDSPPAGNRPAARQPAVSRPAGPEPAVTPPAVTPPAVAPPIRPQRAAPAASLHPGILPPAGPPSAGAVPASSARHVRGPADRQPAFPRRGPVRAAGPARTAAVTTRAAQFRHHIPLPVRHAFTTTARATLLRAEPLYRDVASDTGIDWRLLAACDWMQCEAQPRHSPVRGERLGTVNPDGTVYRTKSEALAQCALDLVDLALTVYGIDLVSHAQLSVRDLASAFAAFRWGGLLRAHHTSAMEFPYSVAGLTDQHTSMRWPDIADPNTPDKPGSRFRKPFGAVPIVLSLNLPATV